LFAVNSFRADQASFGQISALFGRNLDLFRAILPQVGTLLPYLRLA
jgi:hypothetical protein